MQAHAALLEKLFAALAEHDHEAMASCYHPQARFRDIAFDLRGRQRIHDMWRMICAGDIKVVDFEVIEADGDDGRARIVEEYSFHRRKPGDKARVRNAILSRFRFEGGKIRRQDDDCDPKEWARQALGTGMAGFLAGRIRLLRAFVARRKLARFVDRSPASPN